MKIPHCHWKLLFLIQFFVWKFWRFLLFFGENFVTRCSRLSRRSRAPSRVIRPRLIDCDRGPEQTVKSFPAWGFEHRQKVEVFSKDPPATTVLIYTPKEAHVAGLSWPGGQCSRDKCWPKQKLFLARPACSIVTTNIIRRITWTLDSL